MDAEAGRADGEVYTMSQTFQQTEPITPADIIESRVSVIELFNNKTQQRVQIYWDGHTEGLDDNWVVKNLLPSGGSFNK